MPGRAAALPGIVVSGCDRFDPGLAGDDLQVIAEPAGQRMVPGDRLRLACSKLSETPATISALMAAVVEVGLPFPARGNTRARFAGLQAAGEIDLTMARLYEAHTDALAILDELGGPAPAGGSLWGVWAAESSDVRLTPTRRKGGWRLDGRKAWCSGAGLCTHALVTCIAPDGPRLFAVDLSEPGVQPIGDSWPVPAMQGTDTRPVSFRNVAAAPVGRPNGYLGRSGFWHGACGVAAVWTGGAIAIGRPLLTAARERPDDLLRLHLGVVDSAIAAAKASIDAAADQADADPRDLGRRARLMARRARAAAENAVETTVTAVGHALGPGPLTDSRHASRVSDLLLYVRQSHAERDLVDLATQLVERGDDWSTTT